MIKEFIQENIECDIKSFETKEEIYSRYLKFCNHYNCTPLTKIILGKRLSELNVGIKHSRMKNRIHESGRQGVKLLPCKY